MMRVHRECLRKCKAHRELKEFRENVKRSQRMRRGHRE